MIFFYFAESLLRYTAPRSPDIGPSGASIQDSSYDGPASSQRANFVTGGLGQLTDGLFGDDDFLDEYRGPNSGTGKYIVEIELVVHCIVH